MGFANILSPNHVHKLFCFIKGKRQLVGGAQSSLSEFSEHSSMELDLEFDLYDYDLNNVIASNQPGSMFAQNTYYDFYDFDEDEDLGMHTFICKEDWKNKKYYAI